MLSKCSTTCSSYTLLPSCNNAQAVDPALNGNAAATFDEVVSRLARFKAVYKGYASAREALLLNGRFILRQLDAADRARRGAAPSGKDKGKGAAGATEWAFYKGLEAEVRAQGRVLVFKLRGDAWAHGGHVVEGTHA
jgi:hypothetical protein